MPDPKPIDILPGMPYTVRDLQFGPHMRPTRLYANGRYGDILTDEEIAVWDVVQGFARSTSAAAHDAPIDPALTNAFREYIGEEPVAVPTPKPSRKRGG